MLKNIYIAKHELGLWFRRRPGENDPGESNHSANRSKP